MWNLLIGNTRVLKRSLIKSLDCINCIRIQDKKGLEKREEFNKSCDFSHFPLKYGEKTSKRLKFIDFLLIKRILFSLPEPKKEKLKIKKKRTFKMELSCKVLFFFALRAGISVFAQEDVCGDIGICGQETLASLPGQTIQQCQIVNFIQTVHWIPLILNLVIFLVIGKSMTKSSHVTNFSNKRQVGKQLKYD